MAQRSEFTPKIGMLMRVPAMIVGCLLLTGMAAAEEAASNVPYAMFKINVSNLQRSVDFYTRVLGLRESWRIGSDDFAEVVLDTDDDPANGASMVLVYRKGQTVQVSPTGIDTIIIMSPSSAALKTKADRIAKAGMKIDTKPSVADIKQGTYAGAEYALARDPDGYVIELLYFRP